MPRTKRHYLPGYTCHITQRCHKKEFLLKFHCDKRNWLHWLHQAKQRFRISILNYMVTSNHVHMLVQCDKENNYIAKAIHLASGRTAWEYNQRKRRQGAFWQDRYHATAVETDKHLIQCMMYIDMNMVRAGVVKHPREWPFCGYQEIVGRRQRYTLIDLEKLMHIIEADIKTFRETYIRHTEEYLFLKRFQRESCWTESIAVGGQDFTERIQTKLGVKAKGRKILEKKVLLSFVKKGFLIGQFWPQKSSLRPKITGEIVVILLIIL